MFHSTYTSKVNFIQWEIYYQGEFCLSQFYKSNFGKNILNFKILPRKYIEGCLLFHLSLTTSKSIDNCQRSWKMDTHYTSKVYFFLSKFHKLSFGKIILNFKISPRQSIEGCLLFHLKQDKLKSIENCQRS